MRLLFADFTLPQLLKDAEFPAGGWAVQLRQLLIGLSKVGHRAGVLTWKGANAYVGPQSACDLLETYDRERGVRKLRYLYYFLPTLYSAARAYRPDAIIQSCAGVDTGTMALIAQTLRVPLVYRIASDADTDGRNIQYLDLRGRIGFRYGLKRSRMVICQNAYQLGHVRKQFPLKPADILHNCILIPTAFSAAAIRPQAQRRYVAWVGNFRPPKNVPLLLDIAQQLPELQFRIAGALPSVVTDSTILAALEELRALKNVTFVGYLNRSAVLDFLSGASALLCTSDFEGFSNTILEAFAAGTPVILRAAVDPDAIVRKNGLGLVAQDGQNLVRCLRELYAMQADRREELGRRCRRYVESHHTPAAAVQKLIAMLEPLVQRGSGAPTAVSFSRSRPEHELK